MAETIAVLKEEGIIKISENGLIGFTSSGRQFIEREEIYPKRDLHCRYCEGRGVNIEEFKDLLKRFEEVTIDRPKPIVEFDQGNITSKTVISRMSFMLKKGDLEGKKLLILGDDDLMSIAVGLSGLAMEVIVLEIDDRLVSYINLKSKDLNLSVKAFKYDFHQGLPKEFVGYFDIFNTDPPETLEALELCMKRGITGLCGMGCAGYFGLTKTEASLRKWNEFQRLLINKFDAVITDIIDNFNHYENWDYLLDSIRDDYTFLRVKPEINWYRSAMYRIELLSDLNLVNKDEECELYVDREALVYKPTTNN